MIVVVAVALLPVMVVVLVSVFVIMVVVVIVVVAVAFDVLVELVVQAGVVDGVVHLVLELVLVNVQDGAHEVEVDLLLGLEGAVVLDTVVEVREVEGHTVALVGDDGSLDVAEHAARLFGDPLADLHEGLGEPRLRVGVVACDGTGESDRAAACLLDGCGLVVLMIVVVAVALLPVMVVVLVLMMMLVFSAHLIIS